MAETAFKIPPPSDPKERAEWEKKVAQRKAEGKGTAVGDEDMADDKGKKKDAEVEGGQEPNVDYKGALKGAQEAHTNFQTAKDQYRKGDITPELFNAAKQTYEASAKDFDKTFAEAQIRGDSDLPRLNPLKISRLADSIGDIAKRFDAHARMDAAKGFEIELGGKRYSIPGETDAAIDAAVKKAGMWKPGKLYPNFTIYENGEEISGGGGSNSGVMGE